MHHYAYESWFESVIGENQGHKLFFQKVESILNQLYIDENINRKKYKIFDSWERAFSDKNDRDFKFFISTNYNYAERIWKSGFFEITQNDWQSTNTEEYRFPELGTGLGNYGYSHVGDIVMLVT